MKVEKLSDFLLKYGPDSAWSDYFGHWCPACNEMHAYAVARPQANGAHWSFDGNLEKPSFSPSMKRTTGPWGDGETRPSEICHYFLTAGQLRYCDDCTHDLRGKTIDLPPIPEETWKTFNVSGIGVGESDGME